MLPVVFGIPSYLLFISLIYSIQVFWLVQRSEKFGFERNKVIDVAMAVMLGGFIGARLLHVIWEEPAYYAENPKLILYFWQGGFVFFGGLLGAVSAGLWVIRKEANNLNRWFDLFAPLVAAGYALGRLSCLAAGCCYGRRTDVPWCITFPQGVEAPAGICLHPTQIYAFLWESAVLGLLLFSERNKNLKPGVLFFIWLALHSLGRMWQEYFRADFRGPVFSGITLSSVIAAGLFLFAFYKIRLLNKKRG